MEKQFNEELKRPEIKQFFGEDATLTQVMYTYESQPELFKYAQALDNYIDQFEQATPSLQGEKWVEVPISELPEKMKQAEHLSVNVVGVFNNGSITYPVWYDFNKNIWTYGKGELTTLTHWLKRTPPSTEQTKQGVEAVDKTEPPTDNKMCLGDG